MNTAQITHALEEDPITKKSFVVYFPVINYLKRSTSILADLSRTQIRVASLELTGSQFGSVQVMLGGTTTRFWGNILTATGLMYHWCLETIWKNTLINGNITNVNCKVFGPTYAVITVYST